MRRYIELDSLVAEIEKRKHKLLDHIIYESDKEWVVRTAHQLNRILLFIDTLEVKEVDLDKEYECYMNKEISEKEWTREDYLDFAKHFFELGLKAQKGE